jgi:folate-binding protein YgfZ
MNSAAPENIAMLPDSSLTATRTALRSFGDTAAEYDAARTRAIVVDRADRALIRVFGRDPVKMVHGLVTNDVQNLAAGESVHAAMLTPKGRMLADVRVIRRTGDLLIECDTAAAANVTSTLAKYVPPLFARSENMSEQLAVAGIYGPSSTDVLARLALGDDALVLPTDFTGDAGFDFVIDTRRLEAIQNTAVEAGAVRAGHAVLDVLRIEAGTPRWGAELDEDVIPIEAGLTDRLISMTKGCYTGQEVIVRILHRGHVNRHLRGLLFGDSPTPSRGAQLFVEGSAKAVGHVTSACFSPRLQEAIALAYLRREIEPGAVVHVSSETGSPARVTVLPFPIANPQATDQ